MVPHPEEPVDEPPRDTVGRDEPTGDASTDDAATDNGADDAARTGQFDLKALLRQLTTPMVESLDLRLRDQIEAHVDALLTEKVDAAIRDRLSTLDRAIADLSRSLEALERRISESPSPES